MKHTSIISTVLKHLLKVLMVMCAVLFCLTSSTMIGATQTAFAQPCDGGDVSLEADDSCTQPCQGGSPEDGDCLDDCQFCSCCSMVAPAALVGVSMGFGVDVPVFRGDLPPPAAAVHGGIHLRIFKPPRHLSA